MAKRQFKLSRCRKTTVQTHNKTNVNEIIMKSSALGQFNLMTELVGFFFFIQLTKPLSVAYS